jgi:hypothetical protein
MRPSGMIEDSAYARNDASENSMTTASTLKTIATSISIAPMMTGN